MADRWVSGPDAAQLLGVNRAALEAVTMAMEIVGIARREGGRWVYDSSALAESMVQDRGAVAK
jgi:hypothetical protein